MLTSTRSRVFATVGGASANGIDAVTNTSVNPARSTGPALFAGSWALAQLWLFWVAPLVGAAAAGFVYRELLANRQETNG
jgi:glycerol uptake facilitator-like aquaporin